MKYRVFIRVNNNWLGPIDSKQITVEKDEIEAGSYREAVEKVLDDLDKVEKQ